MIFANIHDEKACAVLDGVIRECLAYAKEHDMLSFETGKHQIDGDRFWVNMIEYETTEPENRFWEAHKDYLDVHYVLSGEEQIDLNFIRNMTETGYVAADDFVKLEGEKNASVILRPGDFLVCYPDDAHRTAVAVSGSCVVKKGVFKVHI